MKKVISILFVLSLALNILLGAYMLMNSELDIAQAAKDINIPGTYGPPAMEIIDDDVSINTAEVTLQNTLVTGNLYLEGIGEGTVTLNQVEVQGDVLITAGGEFTLVLADCAFGSLAVENSTGAVTLIAQDSTEVETVELAGEAMLQEDGLAEGAQGFKHVNVNTDKKVVLLGNFTGLDIGVKNASVKIVKGNIEAIKIKDSAGSSELDLAKDVTIGHLLLNATLSLTGEGTVEKLDINTAGLVKAEGMLAEVNFHVKGVFFQLRSGNIDKLLVPELDSASSINLAEGTTVDKMELNARAGVTGKGQIGTATINTAGVEIEQTPETIVIEEGLVALINNEEYRYEPEQEPEPEPATPTVALGSIGNVTMHNFGETKTVNISVQSGARVTVSSSSNVASASLSGNTITVTGNRQGTATITVRASMSGHNSRTRTFKVTVDPIKLVERRALTPLTYIVAVTLYDNDPDKYRVVLEGYGELPYDIMNGNEKFWDDVPDGKQDNRIIVTER